MVITLKSKETHKFLANQFSSTRVIAIGFTFFIFLGFLFFTPQVFFSSSKQSVSQIEAGHLSDHTSPQSECGPITTDPIKRMTLIAQPVVHYVAPSHSFSTWSFNGSIPGPTICLNEEDTLILTLVNHLSTIASFHAHGLQRDFRSDGTYMSNSFAIPGGSYTYTLYADNYSVGTWAYHDAVAELDEEVIVENVTIPESGEGIERGMFGAIIVYGKNETVAADHEVIIVEAEFEAEITGGPTYMTFNGRISPYTPHYIFKLGETIRFRVINVGPNADHDIIIPGMTWKETISGVELNSAYFGALEFGDFIMEASELIDTAYICGIGNHQALGMVGEFTIIP